jgi:SMI1 / KNR4 family (SUKH-1)
LDFTEISLARMGCCMTGGTLFSKLALNPGASAAVLEAAQRALQHTLPSDYANFLRASNGGEGFVGDNYLALWKAEELKQLNDEYQVPEYAPGLLLFGSDGGGEAYAFDTRQAPWTVVQMPFVGMDLRYARPVGSGFTEFLRGLA